MKNARTEDSEDDIRPEYAFDYSKARPNRFASRMARGSMGVLLAPDVAAAFPSSDAVNEALRGLLQARTESAPASTEPCPAKSRRARKAGS